VVGEKEDENAKPGEEKKEKKVNADSGKIVNLMAGDTNRSAFIVGRMSTC
jgi:hypothetical protein